MKTQTTAKAGRQARQQVALMDAEEIVRITPAAISQLVDAYQVKAIAKHPAGQRREERWPFPGTVEVWLPEGSYGERHLLATLHNLSRHGLAMRSHRPIPKDTQVSLAIHQPQLSCYGQAVIRHCTHAHVGYLIGAEFIFEPEDEEKPEHT